MKPEYWIGVLTLVGTIAGCGLLYLTGWFDSSFGTLAGVLAGVLLYKLLRQKHSLAG